MPEFRKLLAAPHEPEYQFQLAPVPRKLSEETDNVVELETHIDPGLAAAAPLIEFKLTST